MLTGGILGEIFTALAFASAFVSMAGYLMAEREAEPERRRWEQLGRWSFLVHAGSIAGIMGTLFYLIYTHHYEYHYVWAHSSNELPVYYMISCFWEGQEGSFLLWCLWHSVLGLVAIRTVGAEWRRMVMAVLASVELILTSMVLGVYAGPAWVWGIYLLLILAPAAWMGWRYFRMRNELPGQGLFQLAAAITGVLLLTVLFRGQSGFAEAWSWSQSFSSGSGVAFGLLAAALLALCAATLYFSYRHGKKHGADIAAALTLLTGGLLVFLAEPAGWKLGSTPFLLLRDAFPDNEVFLRDPDFVPVNGSGLNSLLQNYWMVIHPPTLFLGFALTVIPFAFAVAGLVKGEYAAWIKPARPWTILAVAVLGVGIIMGGYWAYETLNFGGYWNWDPVENGSLVPWLCGIAALHIMLVQQRTRSYLRLSIILVVSTFLLVLYATFLTRSGILGDTSVHTFTDLGLSGQLLVLLLAYVGLLVVLMLMRWRDIQDRVDDSPLWSAPFMLFAGVLVFVFAAAEISLSTSLPVINKLFGANLAPPAAIQFFYYQWNVWFAVAFGVLSGVGQFLWWRLAKKRNPGEALFRPFLIAMVLGSLILMIMSWNRMEFAFQETYQNWVNEAGSGTGAKIWVWLRYGLLFFADELLLFAALFSLFANFDILISLLRSNQKGLRVMGGTVAHIGFALMLAGILFSSGYDAVVSTNITPEDLTGFSEKDKQDNVLLLKDRPRSINGYMVTYKGRKEAIAPIRNLSVIEETPDAFKVRFKDATGDVFGFQLPRREFLKKDSANAAPVHPARDNHATAAAMEGEIDIAFVKEFMEKNLEYLRPGHINNRILYTLEFRPLSDTARKFVLYPEAEINTEQQSIIAHPARKISAAHDLYVHVSSIPGEEEREPEYRFHELALKPGDTSYVGKTQIYFHNVNNISDKPELRGDFEYALAANVLAIRGQDTFLMRPMYFIGYDNRFSMREAAAEELHIDIALYKIEPEKGLFLFQVREQLNPNNDWVVFKAIRKPWINLLWLGTFVLTAGFGIAVYRRIQENRSGKSPEQPEAA